MRIPLSPIRAVGWIVGRFAGDYWQVPALVGIDRVPSSDEVKCFGAALASFGSVALFKMLGVTPQAEDAIDPLLAVTAMIAQDDLHDLPGGPSGGHRCSRRGGISSPLVVTSPQVKPDADRVGITARIEARARWCCLGRLLSELCARDGRGKWLEKPGHALREAAQASRRLWPSAGVAVDTGMCRCGTHWTDRRMIEFRVAAAMG